MGQRKDLGLIFDIQRYSIHDGPGIRTLISMKGCPLKCLWRANPEGQLSSPEMMYSANKCIQFWECIKLCPLKAILKNNNGNISIDRENCNNCGKCSTECYSEALQFVGRYISKNEIFKSIEKDRTFHDISNGGVTLGGGEPLVQIKFVKELLKIFKKKGINTAVETCGYTEWRNIKNIIGLVDTFFYDIKHMDPQKHLELTGVSNEIILQNLKKLSQLHVNIIVRFPLIPGYNDQEENLNLIVRFLNKLDSIKKIEIMSYHRFGSIKYEHLGRYYELRRLKSFSKTDKEIQAVKQFLKDNTKKEVI